MRRSSCRRCLSGTPDYERRYHLIVPIALRSLHGISRREETKKRAGGGSSEPRGRNGGKKAMNPD